MKHKITIKIFAFLLLAGGLFLGSGCEPPLCAFCYDQGFLEDLDGRDIEICAEDMYELEELVWLTEDMGYYCEYQ